MEIKNIEFIKSSPGIKECPPPNMPEYAFIGRSNVGKSSLINSITNKKGLAKTSSTPGKTQLINHFLVNNQWYLTDLPGYGYAKVSKKDREKFSKLITDYLQKRENLMNVFMLIDSRHEPLKNDLEFMTWLGENNIPFSIIFTKIDKIGPQKLEENIDQYKSKLLETWEEVPKYFMTSAEKKIGNQEILDYIEEANTLYKS